MPRKARHLQVLEESKKEEYNLDKPSKIKNRIEIIQDARYDEGRHQANLYAMSLNKTPPNKLSYEKGGKKINRKTPKSKTPKSKTRRNKRTIRK